MAEDTSKSPSLPTIPVRDRLAAAGLALPESDIALLEQMGPEIDLSAAAVRKGRSYFEEPIHVLRLQLA